METKANYVAVGAFVLACMLALVVTVLWLAGVQYSQEYVYYTTKFTGSVTGLGKGTTVRYNGIEVGRVDGLDFAPNDPSSVIATLQVRPDLSIYKDATASIASQGLTGGSYVEIIGGKMRDDADKLAQTTHKPYPEIRSVPSTWAMLQETAPQIVHKVDMIADKLNNLLSPKNQKAIGDILSNLDNLTKTLSDNRGEIVATLHNTNEATRNLAVASRDLHPTFLQANATLRRLDKLSKDADAVVTGDGISQLSALIADSRRLVGSLTTLSDQLNREPTRVIFGDRRKGYTPK
ncbi:MAG TPA: MlaD family protein [Rhizomicrobium sp.]|jgi:phospholipid/cholesterol/gamma-HCH transport system substrate-binding protein|nr:MlaD family protein [Rhizomicrobium sp.]